MCQFIEVKCIDVSFINSVCQFIEAKHCVHHRILGMCVPVYSGDACNQSREVTICRSRHPSMRVHECTKVSCVSLERHIRGVHFSHLNILRVPFYRGYMYRCVLTQYASLQRLHTVYTKGLLEYACQFTEVTHVASLKRLRIVGGLMCMSSHWLDV